MTSLVIVGSGVTVTACFERVPAAANKPDGGADEFGAGVVGVGGYRARDGCPEREAAVRAAGEVWRVELRGLMAFAEPLGPASGRVNCQAMDLSTQ